MGQGRRSRTGGPAKKELCAHRARLQSAEKPASGRKLRKAIVRQGHRRCRWILAQMLAGARHRSSALLRGTANPGIMGKGMSSAQLVCHGPRAASSTAPSWYDWPEREETQHMHRRRMSGMQP